MITLKPDRLLFALLPFVAACSSLNPVGGSEFNCPGMGPGACTTPRNAYEMSNGTMEEVRNRIERNASGDSIDVDGALRDARAGATRNPANAGRVMQSPVGAVAPDMRGSNTIAGVPPELAIQADSATPVRMPAQVMRIRIFPWTDTYDNLHSGGYIYTEIEPRKWSFGVMEEGVSRNARVPHLVSGKAPSSLTQDLAASQQQQGNPVTLGDVPSAQSEVEAIRQQTGVDLSSIGLN